MVAVIVWFKIKICMDLFFNIKSHYLPYVNIYDGDSN